MPFSIEAFSKDKNIGEMIVESKEYLFSSLCYIAGLLMSALIYTDSPVFGKIAAGFKDYNYSNFTALVLYTLAVGLSVYAVTVLMGTCVLGFPFLNAIPLMCGFITGIRTAFFYTENGVKGFGYVLLLIAPETAALMTVIIFCIDNSTQLSKSLFALSIKKEDALSGLNLKMHLKKSCIYGIGVTLVCLLNATSMYLLNQLIHL